MGLASALDHMELVGNHSFRQQIWPELKGHDEVPKIENRDPHFFPRFPAK